MRKFMVILIATIFLYGASVGTALADDTTAPATGNISLTIQQAMDMALQNSRTIQSAQLDIQSQNEAKKTIESTPVIQYIPSGPTSPSEQVAFTNLRSAGINWEMSIKTLSVKEDAVVYTVLRDYIATINALDGVTSAQNSLANAQLKVNIARLQLQLGLISSSAAIQAEATYDSAKTVVNAAQISESDAYHAFNNDVGLDPEARPVLTERPQYSPYSVDNLYTKIISTVAVNPQVWLSYKAIELANLGVDLYDYSSAARSGSLLSKEIDVQQANITAANTQDQAEQLMRTIYNNILKTEQQYNTQLETLQVAQDTLRIANIRYEVGIATKMDVSDAQLAVNNATQALNTTIYQHELWKMAFEKPWAFSGAS